MKVTGLTLKEAYLWNALCCSNLERGRAGLSHGKGEGVLVRGEGAHVLVSMDEVRNPYLSFSFFLSVENVS
jgi:hypothetical protein